MVILGRQPSTGDVDFSVSVSDVENLAVSTVENTESRSSESIIELDFRSPEAEVVQGIDDSGTGEVAVSYEVVDPFQDDFGPDIAEQIVGVFEDPTADSPSPDVPVILGSFTDPTVDSEDTSEARFIGALEDPFAVDDSIEYEPQILGEYAEP